MLESAAVGNRGRDHRTLLVMCALAMSPSVASISSQSQLDFQDLSSELTAKIASAIAPATQVSLTAVSEHVGGGGLQTAIANLLSARGVRVGAPADGVVSIQLSCSSNLRERSCLAQIQRDATRSVVVVTRPLDDPQGGPRDIESRTEQSSSLTLELRPLFAQRGAILDAVALGNRVLVLDPESVTIYERNERAWQRASSRPIPTNQVWPRDMRGRLRLDSERLEVFLPGVLCRGNLNSTTIECANTQTEWPLGLENTGLQGARNYFGTRAGLSFFAAAALGENASARWLIADRSGALTFLDAAQRPIGNAGTSDEVIGLRATCSPETYVVTGARAEGRDALRLSRVTNQRLVDVGPPLLLSGTLTALWATPGASTATAVAHNAASGRHEAFLVSISCSR